MKNLSIQYMHFQRFGGQEFQIEERESAKTLRMLKKQKNRSLAAVTGAVTRTSARSEDQGLF